MVAQSESVPYRMHPLTLRLQPDLESAFQEEYFGGLAQQARVALAVAIASSSLSIAVIHALVPQTGRELDLLLGYQIVTAGIGVIFGGTAWLSRHMRAYLAAITTVYVLAWALLAPAIVPPPLEAMLFVGAFLTTMWVCFLVRFGFIGSAAVSAIQLGGFSALTGAAGTLDTSVWVLGTIFEAIGFVFVLFGSYALERFARQAFVARRLLEVERQLRAEDRARSDALLESFADSLRRAGSPLTLQSDLLRVVDETVRPTHVSLWLRAPVTTLPPDAP